MRDILKLKKYAREVRKDILDMLVNGGHFGGSFSCTEILLTLYMDTLTKIDKFILSKGHASVALYSVLSKKGMIDRNILTTHRKNGSILGVHAERYLVPGVELSCGSLGHGLSYGGGIALGNKLNHKDGKVFVLLGDGESEEGSVWEAIMFASQHNLDNLIAIVDYNHIQSMGRVEDIVNLEPLADKWKSFGWEVMEVNGHDFEALIQTFDKIQHLKGKPITIIAHTLKGKGLSIIENKSNCHYPKLNEEEVAIAKEELKI